MKNSVFLAFAIGTFATACSSSDLGAEEAQGAIGPKVEKYDCTFKAGRGTDPGSSSRTYHPNWRADARANVGDVFANVEITSDAANAQRYCEQNDPRCKDTFLPTKTRLRFAVTKTALENAPFWEAPSSSRIATYMNGETDRSLIGDVHFVYTTNKLSKYSEIPDPSTIGFLGVNVNDTGNMSEIEYAGGVQQKGTCVKRD